MNPVGSLFRSSIGRKILMAVSGLVLIGFVVWHLIGNLQVFQDPDYLNGYAQFLHQQRALLWVARIGLLVAAAVHLWAGVTLSLENTKARGSEPYGVRHTIRATLASRTMKWTGLVVLAFVIYHLAHFTYGGAQSETFAANLKPYVMRGDYRILGVRVVDAGTPVADVYNMVVLGFQHPVVSVFYIVAIGLLTMHLVHGCDSMFQTLGLRSNRWSKGLRTAVILLCVAYFVGNLAIPGAALAGLLQPQPAATAAAR